MRGAGDKSRVCVYLVTNSERHVSCVTKSLCIGQDNFVPYRVLGAVQAFLKKVCHIIMVCVGGGGFALLILSHFS